MKEKITLGSWTIEKLEKVLGELSKPGTAGERIEFLSKQFLDTPYGESTLAGDISAPEFPVINFEKVDCFTLLDYIEAMRLSRSSAEFSDNLRRVRYQSGKVSFISRNHFFSDWIVFNQDLVEDITGEIGGDSARIIYKTLNRREDGAVLIPGIPCRERKLSYIPSVELDDNITEKLLTGDYIGIYSDKDGLDVSHLGIIIKQDNVIIFRHASSSASYRKVIDQDFYKYIKDKPGIIVLRAKPL